MASCLRKNKYCIFININKVHKNIFSGKSHTLFNVCYYDNEGLKILHIYIYFFVLVRKLLHGTLNLTNGCLGVTFLVKQGFAMAIPEKLQQIYNQVLPTC